MRLALLVLALGAACPALAQEDTRAMWYQRTDNDVVFGTDRWYSSGVRLARVHDGVEYGLVHEVYVPEAKHWVPGIDDRAPVGRLLFSGAWQDREETLYRTVEFFAGVRGPAALGRQVTRAVHHVVPRSPYVDWTRQLDNHFDGGMSFTHSQVLGSFVAHAGAVVGNQVTHAHAGFEWRAGTLSTITSAALRFAPTPPMPPRGVYGWSVFAGASVRGVARNELIGRNYDPFGPDIAPRRGVARVAAGAAYTASWGTVEVELVGDSKEFAAQRTPQGFGSLAVHFNL